MSTFKPWTQFSEEELANISEEEYNRQIKRILAEEGIKILIPPAKPESPKINSDVVAYRCSLTSDIIFGDILECKQFVEFLKKCKSIGHSKWLQGQEIFKLGTELDYYGNPKNINLDTVNLLSQSYFDKIAKDINAYNDDLKNYEIVKKEYELSIDKADAATENFRDAYTAAKASISKKKKLLEEYCINYLPTADGDSELAMKFFIKAYNPTEDQINYIKSNLNF